jgi:hypothetical protein
MARLLIKTAGLENRTLELRLGVNRVGRDPDSDFPIIHPTVSTCHCEFEVSNDGVTIRDCGSTNGTFINGDPVKTARLLPGQEVRLGEVELFVENTEVSVAIPQFDRDRPKPPTVLPDGALACGRHPAEHATYRCTHCQEVMCNHCIHIMRIKGGQSLFLCPLCSHKCEPLLITAPMKKKKGIRGLLDTVKLKFGYHSTGEK